MVHHAIDSLLGDIVDNRQALQTLPVGQRLHRESNGPNLVRSARQRLLLAFHHAHGQRSGTVKACTRLCCAFHKGMPSSIAEPPMLMRPFHQARHQRIPSGPVANAASRAECMAAVSTCVSSRMSAWQLRGDHV